MQKYHFNIILMIIAVWLIISEVSFAGILSDRLDATENIEMISTGDASQLANMAYIQKRYYRSVRSWPA